MTMFESTIQRREPPYNADFAVLDLAQSEQGQLLGWLYSHFDHSEIPWTSLYHGSELENSWMSGPVLIELRESGRFHKALTERYQTGYLGMLIHAPETAMAEMTDHLRSLITVQLDNRPSIFRFYDPRSLGSLFETLEPAQQHRLTGPAQLWSWYLHGAWWQWEAAKASALLSIKKPLVIHAAQPTRMDTVRTHQFALSLSHNYRTYIPSDDVESFVLTEVQTAGEMGVSTQADQDRWLRMAIRLKGPVRESEQWKTAAQSGEKTPLQILSQLECEQGSQTC